MVAKAGYYVVINPPAEAGGYNHLSIVHRLMLNTCGAKSPRAMHPTRSRRSIIQIVTPALAGVDASTILGL